MTTLKMSPDGSQVYWCFARHRHVPHDFMPRHHRALDHASFARVRSASRLRAVWLVHKVFGKWQALPYCLYLFIGVTTIAGKLFPSQCGCASNLDTACATSYFRDGGRWFRDAYQCNCLPALWNSANAVTFVGRASRDHEGSLQASVNADQICISFASHRNGSPFAWRGRVGVGCAA